MQDLQLSSGDLMPGPRGFATVTGNAYLQQRIATALAEPYGDDPYNPQWGSTLQSMIGSPVVTTSSSSDTATLVSSEVARVLQALMASQQNQITNTALAGSRSPYSAADVIASVQSTDASIDPADPETVQVSIVLTTQAQQQLAITRTVTAS
jgi:phage baseplate assembly protein W